MRISYWSSDVCSSDLEHALRVRREVVDGVRRAVAEDIMVEPGPPRPTLAVGQPADRVHRQPQRRERKTVLPLPEPVIDEKGRTSVVSGKSVSVRVDIGGGRSFKKKKKITK